MLWGGWDGVTKGRRVNACTCKGEVCADKCLAASSMSHLHMSPTDSWLIHIYKAHSIDTINNNQIAT